MAESKVQRPTQTEAAYKSVSDNPEQTCKECRFFDSEIKLCGLIENSGENEITEKGRCDRWETVPGVSVVTLPELPTEDKAVEPAAIEASIDPTPAPVQPKPGIVERIKAAFAGKPDDSTFQVFKGADGQNYWLARFTNHFEDRDKEILSRKAHEAYVARVNLGLVDMPELWAFHTKGTRHGQADAVWSHEGFVFAIGHFDNTPEAKHAVKFYQRNKGKIELSHGFTYPKWALKDGVYSTYNTFEISTLPAGAASNPYTSFEEITTMALSKKQAEWIEATFGKDALQRVHEAQSSAEKDAEVLKALDTNYKDFADVNGDDSEQPTESIKAGSGEVYANLIADIVKAQAEMADELDALKADKVTAQKAHEDKVSELVNEVAQLKAALSATPKRAATDPATLIDSSVIPNTIKTQMVERDSFWGAEITPTE